MDWKQELLKRLDVLAEKLGTTTAYLWHILTRQAMLTGVADLILSFVLFVSVYVFVRFFKYGVEKCKDSYDELGWGMFSAVSFIGAIIVSIFGISNLYTAVLELANPEYYALREILQTLGK